MATVLVIFACVVLLSTRVPSFPLHTSGECFFNTKCICEYLGQVYDVGERWITSDCYQCVCLEPFGVGCCDHPSKPVDYPEWCAIIHKPDSCANVAVMRADPKLPCLWGQGRF
ncbi:prostate-associated microseminoprotein-like [Syngnathoides biaculeatus]|uniref:prostate-associated microseminoprotein-like n=1 Tax=Syngnathoides biaculeatus TaxID=300417 RepID=UPI002ADE471B|nr:prostate-associated microseminoprotein-like [Syngnathoides biaculeatus]